MVRKPTAGARKPSSPRSAPRHGGGATSIVPPPPIPPEAAAIILKIAKDEGFTAKQLTGDLHHLKARSRAIRTLAEMSRDGRPVFSQVEIGRWFGMSRQRVCSILSSTTTHAFQPVDR